MIERGFETTSVRMTPLLLVTFQAPGADVDRITEAVTAITPLPMGKYDSNAYQSASGIERYRPLEGAAAGAERDLRRRPGTVEISFELPDDEELAATIHREDRDIRVLYLDGAPAGFFDVKPHLPEEAELAYFGMMEHATGQGLGRWFLGAAIEACWSHKPKRVTVQTCTLDHPAALPLYQKLGFQPVAQKTEVVRPMSFEERMASVMRP